MTVTFFVAGEPATQAGMRPVPVGGGRMRQISSGSKGLSFWRSRIATEAQQAVAEVVTVPVTVSLHFRLARPKSRPKREVWPDRKPDLDKLARAALDALTGIAFRDDSQVCGLVLTKTYASPYEPTGLRVTIEALDMDWMVERLTAELEAVER